MCSRNCFKSDGKCLSNSRWSYFSFIRPTYVRARACVAYELFKYDHNRMKWGGGGAGHLLVLCLWSCARVVVRWRIRPAYRIGTTDHRDVPFHGCGARLSMHTERCRENRRPPSDTVLRRCPSCTVAPNQSPTCTHDGNCTAGGRSKSCSAKTGKNRRKKLMHMNVSTFSMENWKGSSFHGKFTSYR